METCDLYNILIYSRLYETVPYLRINDRTNATLALRPLPPIMARLHRGCTILHARHYGV